MQQDLWGNRIRHHRRRKTVIPLTSAIPYAITDNDCAYFGHTVRAWDLAGCTLCTDCGVNIFCPRCIAAHPQDDKAIAMLCERHEEPQESQVSA
jgi:hypothetical protein